MWTQVTLDGTKTPKILIIPTTYVVLLRSHTHTHTHSCVFFFSSSSLLLYFFSSRPLLFSCLVLVSSLLSHLTSIGSYQAGVEKQFTLKVKFPCDPSPVLTLCSVAYLVCGVYVCVCVCVFMCFCVMLFAVQVMCNHKCRINQVGEDGKDMERPVRRSLPFRVVPRCLDSCRVA